MALPSIAPSQMGMPDMPSGQFNMPSAGMFGRSPSVLQNIAGSIGDMLVQRAGGSPLYGPMMQNRFAMNRQAQLAMLQSNLEFQRQMQMAQLGAQLRLQYPDSPLAQSLYQAGVMPGTPEWTKAMQTQAQNELDPVVNAGPYGPVLRSQVQAAGQTPTAPVGTLRPYNPQQQGGPTPSASGGFF